LQSFKYPTILKQKHVCVCVFFVFVRMSNLFVLSNFFIYICDNIVYKKLNYKLDIVITLHAKLLENYFNC
jgi:hypothetical protein